MRFRDPKTDEIYNTPKEAVDAFCDNFEDCLECPLFDLSGGDYGVTCNRCVLDNPFEAARLMGFEVIAENVQELWNMGVGDEMKIVEKEPKPLAEWTLAECSGHCAKWIESGKECDTCVLHDRVNTKICVFNTAPRHLSFAPEQPRFTDEEKAAASILYNAGIRSVKRFDHENSDIEIAGEKKGESWRVWIVPSSMFPSIQPGQSFELTEIMGEDDDHANR